MHQIVVEVFQSNHKYQPGGSVVCTFVVVNKSIYLVVAIFQSGPSNRTNQHCTSRAMQLALLKKTNRQKKVLNLII